MSVIIRGQWGLGDNIYARPFIAAAAARYKRAGEALYLETPWPELFEDLPLKFVRAERRLRTQMENVERQAPGRWSPAPSGAREIRLGYGHADLVARGIVRTIERGLPLCGAPHVMDLPPLGASPIKSRKPIALVRPVTVRSEWRNEARNPDPEYIYRVAMALYKTHHVVVVAHIKLAEEWLCGKCPPHHEAFTAGELTVSQMLALAREANVIVGGVGWIVPAALALKSKAFIVLGGHGAHNSPAVITDSRLDTSRLGFAIPERFCTCSNMLHNCDKRISSLPMQWNGYAERHGLPCMTSSPAGG